MGDRLQASRPSWYVTGHKSQLSVASDRVSSFSTAFQHILGCLVPYDGVEDAIKER